MISGELQGKWSFDASFDSGDETITKSFSSLALSVGWIVQMETSRRGGQLKQGLKIMQKKNPGGQVVEL